ncbi:ATP-dependent Clp protease proteolytic subunit 1 (plasmid) [Piscirickettsia salmonis]|uniref:head maturation protease, ClpP-related n=1 Tax=Piscirickettsia salmonis TaxID=1238 RepID=UPI0012B9FB06|nr:head maturation protease, ClpP-related [Piscirickettsia salmonis]QGP52514.1 ATP-dependent Clp protease proteolytic subunit 1 [Piscirickettsia salmonis]
MPNFNFLAQSNQTDVMIYHSIASGDAAYFIDKVKAIPEDHTINIRINSPGGSVTEGAAMINCIKELGSRCIATVEGVAASMASLIAVSASKTKIAKNAMMMIHHPMKIMQGNAKEMTQTAQTLQGMSEIMIEGYKAKTGLPNDEIDAMLDKEFWMDSKKAKELGFADEIVGDSNIKASINPDEFGYKNVPHALLNPPKQEENKEMPQGSTDKLTQFKAKDSPEIKAMFETKQGSSDEISTFKAMLESQTQTIKQLEAREEKRALEKFEALASDFKDSGQNIEAKSLKALHDHHPDIYANTVQTLEKAKNIFKAEQQGLFQSQGFAGEAKLTGVKGQYQAKVKKLMSEGMDEDEAIVAAADDASYAELS